MHLLNYVFIQNYTFIFIILLVDGIMLNFHNKKITPKLASTDLKLAMQLHQRSFIQDSNENGQESESLCVYWLSLANLYIIEEQYIKAYELVKKVSLSCPFDMAY